MKVSLKNNIVSDMMGGTLAAAYVIFISAALASLVFRGGDYRYFSIGINCALLSACLGNIVIANLSNYRFSITMPDVVPGAIIAIVFVNISHQLPAHALLPTLIATIVVSSLSIGICLFALGYFRLGHLVRFLPYPVIGSFIAGLGWLVLLGAIEVMTGTRVSFFSIIHPYFVLHHIGGLLLGLIIILITRKYPKMWVLPVLLLFATLATHILLKLFHFSHQEAIRDGWLSANIIRVYPWQLVSPTSLSNISWLHILQQIDYFPTMIIVIVLTLLLNISSLELITQTKAKFDKELKAIGVANIVTGLAGGVPVSLSFSGSNLNKRAGAKTQFSSIFAGILCGLVMLAIPNIISYIPKPIIGALLVYVGLRLLIEWLYDAWFKLPTIDCFIILFIFLIVAIFGLLPGVLFGIIITSLVLIISYTRINVIKYALSGKNYHSKVLRPFSQQRWLIEQGERIQIVKLQGYLFFGSAKSLVDKVAKTVEETSAEGKKFIIFDFKLVNSVDSSTIYSFMRLHQLASQNNFELVVTGMKKNLTDLFKKMGFLEKEVKHFYLFPELDYALEWCENELIAELPRQKRKEDTTLSNILATIVPKPSHQREFLNYLEKIEINKNKFLIKQEEIAACLYFIVSGEVSVVYQSEGTKVRLLRSGPGTIIGEMGFYLHAKRSASIKTESNCTVYKLTENSLQQLEQSHPHIALEFHKGIIRILAARLTQANTEISVLSR